MMHGPINISMYVCLSINLCVTLWSKANSDPSPLVIEIKTDKQLLSKCVIFRFHQKPLPGARGYSCKDRARYMENTSRVLLKSRQWSDVYKSFLTHAEAAPPCRIYTVIRQQVFIGWLLSTLDMTPCRNNLLLPKLRNETEVSSYISVNFCRTRWPQVSRDSVYGIANRYGLDGPRIEYRWGRDLPRPPRPSLGSTQRRVQWVLCIFPGGKATGTWRWPLTAF